MFCSEAHRTLLIPSFRTSGETKFTCMWPIRHPIYTWLHSAFEFDTQHTIAVKSEYGLSARKVEYILFSRNTLHQLHCFEHQFLDLTWKILRNIHVTQTNMRFRACHNTSQREGGIHMSCAREQATNTSQAMCWKNQPYIQPVRLVLKTALVFATCVWAPIGRLRRLRHSVPNCILYKWYNIRSIRADQIYSWE